MLSRSYHVTSVLALPSLLIIEQVKQPRKWDPRHPVFVWDIFIANLLNPTQKEASGKVVCLQADAKSTEEKKEEDK